MSRRAMLALSTVQLKIWLRISWLSHYRARSFGNFAELFLVSKISIFHCLPRRVAMAGVCWNMTFLLRVNISRVKYRVNNTWNQVKMWAWVLVIQGVRCRCDTHVRMQGTHVDLSMTHTIEVTEVVLWRRTRQPVIGLVWNLHKRYKYWIDGRMLCEEIMQTMCFCRDFWIEIETHFCDSISW